MKIRVVAALVVLASGAVHLKLWFDGTRHLDVVGPAFLVNVVASAVIAVVLVRWRHWLPLLLAVGFGLSTLGAFVISATVGLFGLHEQWSGPYVWVAAISEVAAVVAGLMAADREGYRSRLGGSRHSTPLQLRDLP